MKIHTIKQLNITVLFPGPINQALITIPDLINELKTNDQERDKTNVVEAPGLKVLIYPTRGKEVIFEQSRLLINDKGASDPSNSDIYDYLEKAFRQTKQDRKGVAAFGFNFDSIVVNEKGISFVNTKLLKAIRGKIEDQGAKVMFIKGEKRYDLQLTPAGSKNETLAHLNIHYATNELPTSKQLQSTMQQDYEEFKHLVQRL